MLENCDNRQITKQTYCHAWLSYKLKSNFFIPVTILLIIYSYCAMSNFIKTNSIKHILSENTWHNVHTCLLIKDLFLITEFSLTMLGKEEMRQNGCSRDAITPNE